MKPDCYSCKWKRDNPGSAHIRCANPAVGEPEPLEEIFAILGSVGRASSPRRTDARKALGIIGHPQGIRGGWFNWPFNFDPAWLENCDGYESKEIP